MLLFMLQCKRKAVWAIWRPVNVFFCGLVFYIWQHNCCSQVMIHVKMKSKLKKHEPSEKQNPSATSSFLKAPWLSGWLCTRQWGDKASYCNTKCVKKFSLEAAVVNISQCIWVSVASIGPNSVRSRCVDSKVKSVNLQSSSQRWVFVSKSIKL